LNRQRCEMGEKHKLIIKQLIGLICIAVIFVAQPVIASEYVSEDWEFTLTPYIWALSVDGHTTVRGNKSKVDMGFDDVWDNLNFALMFQAEARKGRLGMFVSPLFSQLETESNLIDLSVDLNMGSFGGYYRLGPWNLTQDKGLTNKILVVDLYAGGRYTYVEVEVEGKLLNLVYEKGDEEWVDPIIGFRSFWSLSPKWTIAIGCDIGGFGVGSDFAWQAKGVIGYGFEFIGDDNAQFFAGYRVISQDYETGSGKNKFKWDIDLKGPIIGFSYQF